MGYRMSHFGGGMAWKEVQEMIDLTDIEAMRAVDGELIQNYCNRVANELNRVISDINLAVFYVNQKETKRKLNDLTHSENS